MLDLLQNLKEKGNKAFRASQYKDAIKHYTDAVEKVPLISNVRNLDQKVKDIIHILWNNRALCHYKIGRLEMAEEDCSKALIVDPFSLKANKRRAIIRKAMCKWKLAAEDFGFAVGLAQLERDGGGGGGGGGSTNKRVIEQLESEMASARQKCIEEASATIKQKPALRQQPNIIIKTSEEEVKEENEKKKKKKKMDDDGKQIHIITQKRQPQQRKRTKEIAAGGDVGVKSSCSSSSSSSSGGGGGVNAGAASPNIKDNNGGRSSSGRYRRIAIQIEEEEEEDEQEGGHAETKERRNVDKAPPLPLGVKCKEDTTTILPTQAYQQKAKKKKKKMMKNEKEISISSSATTTFSTATIPSNSSDDAGNHRIASTPSASSSSSIMEDPEAKRKLDQYVKERDQRLKSGKVDPLEMFKEMENAMERASMVVATAFREASADAHHPPPKHHGDKTDGSSTRTQGGGDDVKDKNNSNSHYNDYNNDDGNKASDDSTKYQSSSSSAPIENKSKVAQQQQQQPLPRTSYDFRTQTRKFFPPFSEDSGDQNDRIKKHKGFFTYLRNLEKNTLANIFKPEGSLDNEMLSNILVCLREVVVDKFPHECLSILNEVSQAGRITLTIMMITSQAETALEEIFGILIKNSDDVVKKSAQSLRVALDL